MRAGSRRSFLKVTLLSSGALVARASVAAAATTTREECRRLIDCPQRGVDIQFVEVGPVFLIRQAALRLPGLAIDYSEDLLRMDAGFASGVALALTADNFHFSAAPAPLSTGSVFEPQKYAARMALALRSIDLAMLSQGLSTLTEAIDAAGTAIAAQGLQPLPPAPAAPPSTGGLESCVDECARMAKRCLEEANARYLRCHDDAVRRGIVSPRCIEQLHRDEAECYKAQVEWLEQCIRRQSGR